MTQFLNWLDGMPAPRRRTLYAIAGTTTVAITIAVGLLLPAISPLIGGLSGIVLFLITLGVWACDLSEDRQDRTNLRARWPISQRRLFAGIVLAIWLVALLATNGALPGYVGGPMTVWLVLHLAWFIRASAAEQEESKRAWEERQAASQDDSDPDSDPEGDPSLDDYDDTPLPGQP